MTKPRLMKPPVSFIRNSRIYTRTNKECLFEFNKNGRAIVTLDGYLICPLEMFTARQIKMALKKYMALFPNTTLAKERK